MNILIHNFGVSLGQNKMNYTKCTTYRKYHLLCWPRIRYSCYYKYKVTSLYLKNTQEALRKYKKCKVKDRELWIRNQKSSGFAYCISKKETNIKGNKK